MPDEELPSINAAWRMACANNGLSRWATRREPGGRGCSSSACSTPWAPASALGSSHSTGSASRCTASSRVRVWSRACAACCTTGWNTTSTKAWSAGRPSARRASARSPAASAVSPSSPGAPTTWMRSRASPMRTSRSREASVATRWWLQSLLMAWRTGSSTVPERSPPCKCTVGTPWFSAAKAPASISPRSPSSSSRSGRSTSSQVPMCCRQVAIACDMLAGVRVSTSTGISAATVRPAARISSTVWPWAALRWVPVAITDSASAGSAWMRRRVSHIRPKSARVPLR